MNRRPVTCLLLPFTAAFCARSAPANGNEVEVRSYRANTPVEVAHLGSSIAIDGDRVLVGAPSSPPTQAPPGRAFLFDTHTGEQIRRFSGAGSNNWGAFGASVALSGDWALVGSPGYSTPGVGQGRAFLFEVTSDTEIALEPTDPDHGTKFGHAVAIWENIAIVSAPFQVGATFHEGSVYFFDIPSGTQIDRLDGPGVLTNSGFGVDLDVDEGRVLIGAKSHGGFGTGFLFDIATRTLLVEVENPDAHAALESVALEGDTLALGVPRSWGASLFGVGAVYLFSAASGQQLSTVDPPIPSENSRFGTHVALDDGLLVATEPQASGSLLGQGRAHSFRVATGLHLSTYEAAEPTGHMLLGTSVDMQYGNIVIGAAGEDVAGVSQAGGAFLFCASCPGVPYCTSSPNSTGAAATIRACGSTSLAQNDLVLVASPVPDGQPFVFFAGDTQVSVPFGNGMRCAGGNVVRLHAPGIVRGQAALRPIDLFSVGITSAGTLHAQCWFRDPAGGGSFWDLTDALTLNLVP